ncbi:14608_t:CDS:2, partial [Dentiscutata erythropus]
MSITHYQHNTSTKSKGIILDIPVEVYTDICKYIPPIDLVTLSLVCKKFRRWLIAPSNFGTEQIWRTSRTNFLSSIRTPPPGISEQCYTILHLIELGCQFCGAGKVDPRGELPTESPVKIYWTFRVRSCHNCLMERVITKTKIQEDESVLDFALSGLPFLVRINRPYIYWKKDVEDALREFESMDKKDIFNWQAENLLKLRQKNLITSYCNNVARNEPWEKYHKKVKLRTVIQQLSMIVPNDAKRKFQEVEVELRRCPTYKKYAICPKAASAMKLVNEHHWNKFQEIIHHEYNERREYAILRARQYDLFLKVYSLIPSKYSMNDSIVQYL